MTQRSKKLDLEKLTQLSNSKHEVSKIMSRLKLSKSNEAFLNHKKFNGYISDKDLLETYYSYLKNEGVFMHTWQGGPLEKDEIVTIEDYLLHKKLIDIPSSFHFLPFYNQSEFHNKGTKLETIGLAEIERWLTGYKQLIYPVAILDTKKLSLIFGETIKSSKNEIANIRTMDISHIKNFRHFYYSGREQEHHNFDAEEFVFYSKEWKKLEKKRGKIK